MGESLLGKSNKPVIGFFVFFSNTDMAELDELIHSCRGTAQVSISEMDILMPVIFLENKTIPTFVIGRRK